MIDSLVSVVIPTYKRSEMLIRAIRSVLDQSYGNLEVIVVDDNEPDDEYSLSTQKRLQTVDDPRVRYIRQEKHINGCAARNAGIEAASGEYVAFLDDDDVWHKDKLKKQMQVFDSDPAVGLVYTGSKAIYVNDNVSYSIIPKHKGDLKKQILLGNCIGTTSTVVVRKDIIDRAGRFDTGMPARQDYDLWTRICQITEIGFVGDEEIDYYNYRDGGVQISSSTEKYENAVKLLSEKYSGLIEKLSPDEKRQRNEYELFHMANKALRNNEKKKGREYLKKLLGIRFSKKAFALLMLSPFDYKLTLKLRRFHS